MKPANPLRYMAFVFGIAILGLIGGLCLLIIDPRSSFHIYSYYFCEAGTALTLGFCLFALASFRKYFLAPKVLSVKSFLLLASIGLASAIFIVWSIVRVGTTNYSSLSLTTYFAVGLLSSAEGYGFPIADVALRRKVNRKMYRWVFLAILASVPSIVLRESQPNFVGNVLFWTSKLDILALSFLCIFSTILVRTMLRRINQDVSSAIEAASTMFDVDLSLDVSDEEYEQAMKRVVIRTVANQDAMNYLTDLGLSNPRDVIRSENAIRMQFGILDRNDVPLSTEFAQVVGKWTMLQDYAPGLTRLVSEEGQPAMETLEKASSGQIKEYLKTKFPDCMARDDVAALLAKEPKIGAHINTLLTMRNPQNLIPPTTNQALP